LRALSLPTIPNRYLFFGLASLAVLMASIDATIVAVAIPALADAFGAPLTWIGWTLTSYQLVQVVMLPLAGKLSDTLGRKRVFLACVGTFTVGSLLCGLAPSIGWLIAFRALQALGGGGLMPSAVGIVADQFGRRRAQAIGLFTSVFPIGGIIGPNLGGYVLHNWSWRELFFLNVPLGIAVLIGVYFLLAESPRTAGPLRVDWRGLGLFGGAVVALLYGMTQLGNDPALVRSPLLWTVFAASAVLFVLFLRHVRATADPLVDPELVMRNPFLAANLYNFLFGAAAFGFFSFVPYYAVVKYGLTTFESGVVLTPRAIAMMIVSTVASVFIIRFGYRAPMVGGMLLVIASLVLLGQGWSALTVGGLTIDGFWLLALVVAISGVGMGLAGPASNNAALDLAPSQAAAISGLRGMFRQTGGVIGIAGVVLTLSFFPDQAQGLAIVFAVLAGVLLLAVPLVFLIPDLARQRHQEPPRPKPRPIPALPRR
jgi:EmrB/QacA subfamily drug resistance transporter